MCVEACFDTHGRTDLFGLQKVCGKVLAHRNGWRFNDAFVNALAEFVQLDDSHMLRDKSGFVCSNGLEFVLRNHRADEAHRRGVGLDFCDFATIRRGVRNGSCKFEACAQKNACDGIFGQQLESKALGVVVPSNFVHGCGQIDHDKAERRFLACRTDYPVFEVHSVNIEFKEYFQ